MPLIIEWTDIATGKAEQEWLVTPFGRLELLVQSEAIIQVDWEAAKPQPGLRQYALQRQLDQYWANPKTEVSIKLLRQGSTYRQLVWNKLCEIPMGETVSYTELAQSIASGARAVGNACRDNPYPLFIPCHRVVAKSGMGGYCGQTEGELMAIKLHLLAYEARFKA